MRRILAQNAQRRRVQHEMQPFGHRQPPHRSAVRPRTPHAKKARRVLKLAQPKYEPVGAGGHLRGHLAMGAAIEPQVLAEITATNVLGAQALTSAVVPFDQIRLHLACRCTAC